MEMTYPIEQPEDAQCIRWSRVGISIVVFLYGFRSIYNLLAYFEANPIMNWFVDQIKDAPDPRNMPVGARIYTLVFDFLFNFLSSFLCLIGLEALRRHELQFVNDDFYGPNQLLISKGSRPTEGNQSSQSSARKPTLPVENEGEVSSKKSM
jgi:hypothetical protein